MEGSPDHSYSVLETLLFKALDFEGLVFFWLKQRISAATMESLVASFQVCVSTRAMNFRRMKLKCPISMQRPCLSVENRWTLRSRDAIRSLFWDGNKPFDRRKVSFLCLFPG